MQKRKFDELISYFNRKVADMDIDTNYKMELLGMVTALGYAHEKETEERKKGKWIPVTRIEKWHKEDGLVGFPPEVKEFPQCTIEWVDATEPDEVDGLRCSECGTVYDFTEARNWCSECGADMRTPVETARDIVHKAIDNSVWSDTVDTAKMHKVVDDKYVEIRGDANVDANT